MPVAIAERDGVLTLTLDTPRSAVNILNHATARQLVDILGAVDPRTTRAVVFETAKPGSFLNGVGLLLAHAAQTPEGIAAAAAPPWAAYRAVRACPVPTIAVVQGNCFGCGVEFVLQCDFRLASTSGETRFYMTELNDYRFLPLFGGTWNLPEAVGLEHAIDLLLWGARWNGPTAHAHGLVDAVAPIDELAACRAQFVARVLAQQQHSHRRGHRVERPDDARVTEVARRRIAALPPSDTDVYTAGLDLLVRGAQQDETHEAHQARELVASTASALAPAGKAAFAFFYLRQMASERAAGRATDPAPPIRLGSRGAVPPLTTRMRAATVTGVTWVEEADADLVFTDAAGPPSQRNLAVHLSVGDAPRGGLTVLAPTLRAGGRLLEVATGDAAESPPAASVTALVRALQRHGFEVARTTPAPRFVTTDLLVAFLTPLVAAATSIDAVVAVNAALRDLGFVTRPHGLLAMLDASPLIPALAATTGRPPDDVRARLDRLATTSAWDASPDPGLSDALTLTLLDVVVATRARGAVRDLPTIDLLARELLDFPLQHTSLGRWLTRARITAALDAAGASHPLAPASAIRTARAFVVEGRHLYR